MHVRVGCLIYAVPGEEAGGSAALVGFGLQQTSTQPGFAFSLNHPDAFPVALCRRIPHGLIQVIFLSGAWPAKSIGVGSY